MCPNPTAVDFRSVEYLLSAHQLRQLPPDTGREVAFVGRSNAGKSSIINALCQQRIARTSRTPGRTQQLVVFDLGNDHRLVDLPGFGYAKVGREMQQHWERVLARYLETRHALRGLVLVTDIRHVLRPVERQIAHYCAVSPDLRLLIVLNKSDKVSRQAMHSACKQWRAAAAEAAWRLELVACSTASGAGIETLADMLREWFSQP